MQKRERIKTLEGVRALAFLGVMFTHTRLYCFWGTGAWGVSLFFMLSGFVAVYSQFDTMDMQPSLSNNFRYLLGRIKKIYPLHIITTLAMSVFCFTGDNRFPLQKILLFLGLNSALVQDWFPLSGRSINGASWFLCTAVFFYFLFPSVLRWMQHTFTKRKAESYLVICIVIEIIFAVASLFLPHPVYSDNMIFEYDIVNWFVYCLPLSRIVDCIIGCLLGYIFLCDSGKTISNVNAKELLALLIGLFGIIVFTVTKPVAEYGSSTPAISYTQGWTFCVLFIPSSISIIYLFAFGQGKISGFFSKPLFMYFAKVSMYCFLIHYVVFRYFTALYSFILNRIFDDAAMVALYFNRYNGWIQATVGVLISLAATQIWILITKKISDKKNHSLHSL